MKTNYPEKCCKKFCFIFKSLIKYLSAGRIKITSRARFTSVASRLFADGRNRDLSFSLASAGCNRVDIGPPRKSPASTRVLFGLYISLYSSSTLLYPPLPSFYYPNLSNLTQWRSICEINSIIYTHISHYNIALIQMSDISSIDFTSK